MQYPVVAQNGLVEAALLQKAQSAQQLAGTGVIGEDSGGDRVDIVPGKKVLNQSAQRFGHDPLRAVGLSQPIGDLKGICFVAKRILFNINHAHKSIRIFSGDGYMAIIGQVVTDILLCFFGGLTRHGIIAEHELRVAELQICLKVSSLQVPQNQPRVSRYIWFSPSKQRIPDGSAVRD